MQKLVVFSGAGVSAESGIKTFRDSGGLWEEYDIMEVATPEAWARQPKFVLKFYDDRRKQVVAAQPNQAHGVIAELEDHFDVQVITQNIDDLHERAGSKKVLHLHGEIMKSRSSVNDQLLFPVKNGEIRWGEMCPLGSQLRPHVVWFGEEVPAMLEAARFTQMADIFVVVGTSLNVYPAAGLLYNTAKHCRIFVIDPAQPEVPLNSNMTWLKNVATMGMQDLFNKLTKK